MQQIIRALLVSLWFMFLTFPILVIKVDTINDIIVWRWMNALYIGAGVLLLQALWHAWKHVHALRKEDRDRDAVAWAVLVCLPVLWLAWIATRNTDKPLHVADKVFMILVAPLWLVDFLRSPQDRQPDWHDWPCMILFPPSLLVRAYLGLFRARGEAVSIPGVEHPNLLQTMLENQKAMRPLYLLLLVLAVCYPQMVEFYQTNIMVNFMIWIVLGLGLNIVIGLAGLLDLGFVAFYAVGAYAYALLNHHFGLSFWYVLPIGMVFGAVCGLLLGYPVLRLRGDYLAIVTLGFGEIIRLVLENWSSFTHGPSGISNIDRPPFVTDLSIMQATEYMYYIMLGLLLMTIFVVTRLKNSRIGRAWLALKEDEIACQAMGIDKTKTKLTAFALGATWAGLVGVVFAAKTTFINPMSFTLMESIIILSIVVVGGMGSIPGVITGALVLILVPEWLRGVEEYRMLAFGAFMVMVMVFRPQGLVSARRKVYQYDKAKAVNAHE
ncbi:MAG: branched-chain amino acid ABC transporter permease [Desulfovibrio sp.]|nr:branched-chain amino acid ABC transporter permease [Desulfovibrio sp.]